MSEAESTSNQTQDFLMDETAWPGSGIELEEFHAERGEFKIIVSGAGFVMVRAAYPNGEETQADLDLGLEEIQRLFTACVEHDLLSIQPSERDGSTEEAWQEITLVNVLGDRQTVSRWSGEPQPDFEAVYEELVCLKNTPLSS